jgi:hypothetical protein
MYTMKGYRQHGSMAPFIHLSTRRRYEVTFMPQATSPLAKDPWIPTEKEIETTTEPVCVPWNTQILPSPAVN